MGRGDYVALICELKDGRVVQDVGACPQGLGGVNVQSEM